MILDELLKSNDIKKYCYIGKEMQNDLFQDTWVKILEIPEAKLIDIYEKGYLLFYIYRIITSELGLYYRKNKIKKYDISLSDINIQVQTNLDIYDSIDLKKVNDMLGKLHWYDRKLFEIYLEEGSCRKVQAKTKINYNSVQETVRKVRIKLANGIDREFKR